MDKGPVAQASINFNHLLKLIGSGVTIDPQLQKPKQLADYLQFNLIRDVMILHAKLNR